MCMKNIVRNDNNSQLDKTVEVSVVLPVYNEAGSLEILYKELFTVLDSCVGSYEIIFVDDGSTDGSLNILKRIQSTDSRLRVVQFRKNFGQTASLSAGLKLARGNIVITMDADCQNDPADIPRMLKELNNGYFLINF